ncbi:MAG: hypothetical protein QXI89_00315 [Candidatus Anstonellales archaeon]
MQGQFSPEYLEKLLLEDNWRAVLLNLVLKNELDPWNVDIIKLVDYFKKTIENASEKGFYLPSNIILAMAVLLKLKAIRLNIEEEKQEEQLPSIEIKENERFIIRKNRPKLPLSINDIINYIDKMLKKIEEIKEKKDVISNETNTFFELNNEDIKKEMDELYRIIKEKKKTTFFSITEKKADAVVKNLGYILFLANEEKVLFEQHEPFSDIEISILETNSQQS